VVEISGPTLAERVELAVEAHRHELAELVRAAVDRELERLVALELERLASSNGGGSAMAEVGSSTVVEVASAMAVTSRPCTRCGERAAAAGRTLCHRCRGARDRERRAARAADDDGPRPELVGEGDIVRTEAVAEDE